MEHCKLNHPKTKDSLTEQMIEQFGEIAVRFTYSRKAGTLVGKTGFSNYQ